MPVPTVTTTADKLTISETIDRVRDNLYLLKIRFGGGLHSQTNDRNISASECSAGQNFTLEINKNNFSARKPFDLVATASPADDVRGLIEFISLAGTVTTLVQVGGNVYNWNGASTFTLVGTCNAGSRLRGGRWSTSVIDDFVIISDLEKLTVLKKWNGTLFEDFDHNLSGDLFAAYATVELERLILANVKSGATDTPHVILMSGSIVEGEIITSSIKTFDTSKVPISSLSDDAPVFIPTPNLRTINGLAKSFGNIVISTRDGDIYKLTGTTAKDFRIDRFYLSSAARGAESMVYVGNDILVGRNGRIDSLFGVEQFGDIKSDDASAWIRDQVKDIESWTLKYDARVDRVYCWAENGNEIFVLHKDRYKPPTTFVQEGASPWSIWKTDHGNADFRQSSAEFIRSVPDNIDVLYMGGPAGQIYQFDGSGDQDGGDGTVQANRTTGLIELPLAQISNVRGVIHYRKDVETTVTITLESRGESVFDQSFTVTLPAITGGAFYDGTSGGTVFYDGTSSGNVFYSALFERELNQQPISGGFITAGTDYFRVKVEVDETGEFDIDQIDIYFETSRETA